MGDQQVKADKKRCVILAGAQTEDSLCALLRPEDFLLTADAGWQTAQRWGLFPDLAIGDWDSGPHPPPAVPCIDLVPEKDDTDTHYAARLAAEKGFGEVLILGGTGGRLDHTLANISTLLFLTNRGVRAQMADARTFLTVLQNGTLSLRHRAGYYLSLLPLAGEARGITVRGVKYPLENAVLHAEYPLGVSNCITEESAQITVSDGSLLILQAK